MGRASSYKSFYKCSVRNLESNPNRSFSDCDFKMFLILKLIDLVGGGGGFYTSIKFLIRLINWTNSLMKR